MSSTIAEPGVAVEPDSYLAMKLSQKAEHHEFDFDVWYPRLKAHTWASTAVPFSHALATACVHYYQARYNSRRGVFSLEDLALLRELEATLDREMGGDGGFFVRIRASPRPHLESPIRRVWTSFYYENSLWKMILSPEPSVRGANGACRFA
jgi:hypothetical protein